MEYGGIVQYGLGGAAVSNILDAQSVVENSNIEGKEVMISAASTVGNTMEDIVVSKPSSGRIELTDEIREALRVAEKGDISFDGETLTIRRKNDLDIATSGTLEANSNGSMLLGSEEDIAIGSLRSSEEISLKTEGGIIDEGNGDSAIIAGDLVLESDDGAIGSNEQDFRVHVGDGGKFSARSEKDIMLNSSLNDLGVDEILTRENLELNIEGQHNVYDYYQDEESDIRSHGIVLTVEGDIGGRVEGNSSLTGKRGALEIVLNDEAAELNASSSQGVININAIEGDIKVGQVVANSGVALYSDASIVLNGSVEVTDNTSDLGVILDAQNKIEGSFDNDHDVAIAGSYGELKMKSKEGVGVDHGLELDVSVVSLSNESGNISIRGERDIEIRDIAQVEDGDIMINSENNMVLGGGEVFLGKAELSASTEGTGELRVGGDISSTEGAIELNSEQSIEFSDEVTITTEGAEAELTLNADKNILGQDIYLNTVGVNLVSRNGTIGGGGREMTMTSSGLYKTISAKNGVYLEDMNKGLRIDTINEGTNGAQTSVFAKRNLRLGELSVGLGGMDINVQGDALNAESIRGNAVDIFMSNPSGLVDIESVTIEDSLSIEAQNVLISSLQSNLSESIETTIRGINGGHAENVNISSKFGLHFVFFSTGC